LTNNAAIASRAGAHDGTGAVPDRTVGRARVSGGSAAAGPRPSMAATSVCGQRGDDGALGKCVLDDSGRESRAHSGALSAFDADVGRGGNADAVLSARAGGAGSGLLALPGDFGIAAIEGTGAAGDRRGRARPAGSSAGAAGVGGAGRNGTGGRIAADVAGAGGAESGGGGAGGAGGSIGSGRD